MADKQWYMTVGVPGGEYAVKAESLDASRKVFAAKAGAEALGKQIRIAPPDLAQWIECEMGEFAEGRGKVPSGWIWIDPDLFKSNGMYPAVFTPVQGAPGLTVLEESNAD